MSQAQAAKRDTKARQSVEEAQAGERGTAEITDELLNDIDAALEENALVVVRAYVQRGGE